MPRPAAFFVTSLDRVGLAVLAGAALSSLVAMPLATGSGDIAGTIALWLVALGVAATAITAVALPVWLILHRRGRRSPRAAAATGAILALVGTLLLQLGGGADTGGDRWIGMFALAVPLALGGAGVALAMHAVAYRRLM